MVNKEKTSSEKHIVRKWEIKYGYISVRSIKNWREFFSSMVKRAQDITVFGEKIFARKVDKLGRIYVGRSPVRDVKEGDVIICSRDSKGNYSFEKKK